MHQTHELHPKHFVLCTSVSREEWLFFAVSDVRGISVPFHFIHEFLGILGSAAMIVPLPSAAAPFKLLVCDCNQGNFPPFNMQFNLGPSAPNIGTSLQ